MNKYEQKIWVLVSFAFLFTFCFGLLVIPVEISEVSCTGGDITTLDYVTVWLKAILLGCGGAFIMIIAQLVLLWINSLKKKTRDVVQTILLVIGMMVISVLFFIYVIIPASEKAEQFCTDNGGKYELTSDEGVCNNDQGGMACTLPGTGCVNEDGSLNKAYYEEYPPGNKNNIWIIPGLILGVSLLIGVLTRIFAK
jgi:hypothetical protein